MGVSVGVASHAGEDVVISQLQDIFGATKTLVIANKLGMSQIQVDQPQLSSPYEEVHRDRPYRVTVSWQNGNIANGRFTMRIHVLESSCGVLEFNRPNGTFTQDQFNFVMDGIVEALRRKNKESAYDKWGSQVVCTTSSESNKYFVPWLQAREIPSFPPVTNPRTRRKVTVWGIAL